jgi:hypothetical protein
MKFKSRVYEPGEMGKDIQDYLSKATKTGSGYACSCGTPIRSGFVATFPVDEKGTVLDEIEQPRKVPYCEKCDPPDGFNHSYARRVFILLKKE